ncbi:MAG TPA: hypothetical protein VES66_01500 [Terriglobales bacterium]|nr:hypothetical protein [Terriglobales bacterium]
MNFATLGLVCVVLSSFCLVQHDASVHDQHMADVKKHGAEAMGFDQDKTTHHFRLYKDGGAVEVQANDSADTASIGQIRDHLKQQAKKFAVGDFAAPQHTHGQVPPGVDTMTRLRSKIQYEFQPTERGGRLRITTADAQALAAVHDFLRFQIEDHRTGDKTSVE